MWLFSCKFNKEKGFTLIEILVALAVSGFFLVALISFFISTNKLNTVYEKVAGVQQDIRAVMEMMSRDIMMAGLDPTGGANAGFNNDETSENSISFKYSYETKGSCDYNLTYWFDSVEGTIKFKDRLDQNPEFKAITEKGSIDSVVFKYLLKNKIPRTNEPLNKTRMVTIKICGKITGAYKEEFDNTYCFENEIYLRNMVNK
ncbi:MAG: prepilin-type N-terminal cleavage/methylation domain-containing protein [Desulforegulaceae bacterium]|nr:prepilin-type N-terminal cleavage/methylation domain-containing protein [Desulforegulaceae bacterium]